MIVGVGSDIVQISRIEQLITKYGAKFLSRVYSPTELAQGEKISNQKIKTAFFAKRFAAKEAFSKAIGLGIGRGINFADIEVTNDNFGKPIISLQNKQILDSNQQIHLSLSDDGVYALGFIVIERS